MGYQTNWSKIWLFILDDEIQPEHLKYILQRIFFYYYFFSWNRWYFVTFLQYQSCYDS